MANFGDVHYWTRPVHPPRVCYSSGLDGEWNESSHDCVNMSAADLAPLEGDLWPDAPQSQLVICRRLGGLPGVKRQPQYCPMGWNNVREVLVHTAAQRCSNEAGPSCTVEPTLMFQVPPLGSVLAGY